MSCTSGSRAGSPVLSREPGCGSMCPGWSRAWNGRTAGRCRAAGIPEEVEFATKPRQAQEMISRAVAAGVPFAWVTADEVYGQAKWLQAWLEGQDIWYVMAIRCSDTLTTPEGEQRAEALIGGVPARAWQKISTGAGA